MPGMTGFDVCEKMRRLPHCKKTPVIFVTAFSNFDNRKQSVLSGGNDFVSKPVSPVELALKVSVNLIKARVQGTPGSPLEAQSRRGQRFLPHASRRRPRPKPTGRSPPKHQLRNLPRGWRHLPSRMPEMPDRRQLHQRYSPNPNRARPRPRATMEQQQRGNSRTPAPGHRGIGTRQGRSGTGIGGTNAYRIAVARTTECRESTDRTDGRRSQGKGGAVPSVGEGVGRTATSAG